ncbi:hypothetical protein, partial [Bradyrhizobium ottawaense]|uniref:hypothetical protein n=1 Tax=Bradyrhizobium ottawaense TaxID=931866 RepID=UPI0030C67760
MTAPFQCVKSPDKALASQAVPHMGARSTVTEQLFGFGKLGSADHSPAFLGDEAEFVAYFRPDSDRPL